MKSLKWLILGFGGGMIIGGVGVYINAPIWVIVLAGATWGTWCGIKAIEELS